MRTLHRRKDGGAKSVIDNFREKVEQTITFLPPMESIAKDLIEALNNEEVDLRALGKIISTDPSMAANVLKIANSAFFGLVNKVADIEHAVRMLGVNEIASLCISCSALRSLSPPPHVETIDLGHFWRHSIATGVIAKIICRKLQAGRDDSLYLAGLMHDVGVLVLDRFRHDVYGQILDLTYRENIPSLEAERRIMGASHDTVGSWLMEKWNLPDVFVEVARCHHSVCESREPHMEVVAIISLADLFARLTRQGLDGDMNGVIVSETDAFRVLEKKNPHLADLDVVKLVWDLDDAKSEIQEMERVLKVTP
ncbi:MAG: HDOD domain-containing protein [Syntrophorhabdales bacterium]